MKKLLIISSLCFLAIGGTQAQTLQAGMRLGLNRGTLSTKIPNINEGVVQTGYLGGVFARAGILGFFVQPELMFTQRLGAFETASGNYTNTFNYVDANLMVGYSLLGIVRFNLGPSYMMLVDVSQDADAAVKDPNFAKDKFNSSVLGLQIGFGVDLGKFCIDLRYDTNMGEIGKEVVINGTNADYRTNSSQYQFSLGYKFFKL